MAYIPDPEAREVLRQRNLLSEPVSSGKHISWKGFPIALVVLVALGVGGLYMVFGAVLPCDILRKQASKIVLEKQLNKLEGNSLIALAPMLLTTLVDRMVDTRTPFQCTQALFRLDELRRNL